TNGIRVQLKTGSVDCFQSDDFSVDDLATRWTMNHAGDWSITGGKLKPTATGLTGGVGRKLTRSKDSQGKAIAFMGGQVQATSKTAGVTPNGVGGVGFAGGLGAYIATTGPGTNQFVLANDPNGVNQGDTAAFTTESKTTSLKSDKISALFPRRLP